MRAPCFYGLLFVEVIPNKNMYMKKLGLLSLVVIAGMAVYAQDPAMGSATTTPMLKTPLAKVPRFGVKAGANLATLVTKDFPVTETYNVRSKTSLYAGVFANIPLGAVVNFQPELQYSSQGAKVTHGFVGGTEKYEQDLGYIALPLMFQFRTASGFYVEAGPQASYMVSDEKKDVSGPARPDLDFDRFDIAGAAGLGFLSRVGIGVDARYNFGLANIIDDGGAKTGLQVKNSVIQIGLIYHFGANK
jgi:hypothetical protein